MPPASDVITFLNDASHPMAQFGRLAGRLGAWATAVVLLQSAIAEVAVMTVVAPAAVVAERRAASSAALVAADALSEFLSTATSAQSRMTGTGAAATASASVAGPLNTSHKPSLHASLLQSLNLPSNALKRSRQPAAARAATAFAFGGEGEEGFLSRWEVVAGAPPADTADVAAAAVAGAVAVVGRGSLGDEPFAHSTNGDGVEGAGLRSSFQPLGDTMLRGGPLAISYCAANADAQSLEAHAAGFEGSHPHADTHGSTSASADLESDAARFAVCMSMAAAFVG